MLVIDYKLIMFEDVLLIFNLSVIELNIVNILGLLEYFVYFNDDMFLNC